MKIIFKIKTNKLVKDLAFVSFVLILVSVAVIWFDIQPRFLFLNTMLVFGVLLILVWVLDVSLALYHKYKTDNSSDYDDNNGTEVIKGIVVTKR